MQFSWTKRNETKTLLMLTGELQLSVSGNDPLGSSCRLERHLFLVPVIFTTPPFPGSLLAKWFVANICVYVPIYTLYTYLRTYRAGKQLSSSSFPLPSILWLFAVEAFPLQAKTWALHPSPPSPPLNGTHSHFALIKKSYIWWAGWWWTRKFWLWGINCQNVAGGLTFKFSLTRPGAIKPSCILYDSIQHMLILYTHTSTYIYVHIYFIWPG